MKKIMFWIGFACCILGAFGAFNMKVIGDPLLYAGLVFIVSSCAFELMTVFFICAALFWYQTFPNNELYIVAALAIAALVSAIAGYATRNS